MRVLLSKFDHQVVMVGFTADGKHLVALGDSRYQVWNLEAGISASFSGWTYSGFTFVVDPVGRWLYCPSACYGCYVKGLQSDYFSAFPGERRPTHGLAVSRDGSRVVLSCGEPLRQRLEGWTVGGEEGFTQAWSAPKRGGSASFRAITFHPDGARFSCIERAPSGRAAIVVRDAATGSRVAKCGSPFDARDTQMLTTPSGDLIVWTGGQLSLWSAEGRKQVQEAKHPQQTHVQDLALHPSGQAFVTVAKDGLARLWDLATLKVRDSMNWKIGKLHSVAISPDGKLAAAGGDKGQVVLWDVDQ